ncbi:MULTISPECIES: MgtC/SapB family protein [Chryseobacterium]|uniref:MgtC/SapB family protein n=1 Tax=Chryseobacterium TaxID=59732 RepID=UPI000E7628C6|nr:MULTISPECIES: MgtC/SapB family protein [Chryseobacterium]MDH5031882.1 MgtC/SapB family protein [Chryseobacterium cucumeris]MDH5036103.1 MgtC/SapB family protein [Chryseobacterium cucumeris]RKE83032.1 putative Mg2+ transporter-C (MgtC) family protein [Chryseobacterium sp. AG363]
MTTLEFTLRLLTAFALGASIGFERQWRQKSAGLRTNTLVCLGSAAFVLLSIRIGGDATGRIASYIVSGIGFLGGGVIMKDGLTVRGLNTAATIWCSASVGALSAMGFPVEAAITSGFIILTHVTLRPLGVKLGNNINSRNHYTEYLLSIKCKSEVENHIRVQLMQSLSGNDKVLLKSLTSDDNGLPENAIITAEVHASTPQDSFMEKTASRLTIEDKVIKVSWEIIGTENDL